MPAVREQFVIDIPGLGDDRSRGETLIPRLWKPHGLTVIYHPVGWSGREPFEPKQERILEVVDRLAKIGDVSLLGSSAGATAALNTFAQRPDVIKKVVTIAGAIGDSHPLKSEDYELNPAFQQSRELLPYSLEQLSPDDRYRVLCMHGLWDGRVNIKDSVLDGAHEQTLPMAGHVTSIAYALTLGSYSIARFIKSA